LAGEADYSFPVLIKEIVNNNHDYSSIEGLTYRKNENIIFNKKCGVISNLDELPIPAYELAIEATTMSIDIGRGCPFNCTYCSTNDFFSKKYRLKSVDRILSEMNWVSRQLKIQYFGLDHDMLTFDTHKILELCNALIHNEETGKIKYYWSCSARIDCVDKEILTKLKMAGCNSIFFGIESGSKKIQKSIRKNLNISKVYEIADICRETGIHMQAAFIIGFPDETMEDLESTLQCMVQLITKGVVVQASELSLVPGTPLFKKFNGQLEFDGNFSNFSYTLCGLEELKLIFDYPKIFSSFYYLPVNSINRKEILFLTQIINNSGDFRNTFFILKDLLLNEVSSVNLIDFFKKVFLREQQTIKDSKITCSFWISFLSSYLHKNQSDINFPYVYDVFAFEAFKALLRAKFARWQLINQKNNFRDYSKNRNIKIKPVWTVLTTSFPLNKILPSENKWQLINFSKIKRKHKYLLIAQTEKNCIRYSLNDQDDILLQSISEQPVSDFLSMAKKRFPDRNATSWIKRMNKFGVLGFTDN